MESFVAGKIATNQSLNLSPRVSTRGLVFTLGVFNYNFYKLLPRSLQSAQRNILWVI
jgi:hypothetical protein